MATTTPDNLFKPDGNSEAQLKVLLGQMQDSVQLALSTNIRPAMTARVNSAAQRDALFPNPVQGDSVYRNDLGYEQRYYQLYNSNSNPNGKTPAGWYQPTEIELFAGVRGTGVGVGTVGTIGNSDYLPVIKAGRWTTNTVNGGVTGFFTYPKPFPNGCTTVQVTTLSGSANAAVINAGSYNQSGFQALIPGLSSGSAVHIGYVAFGW